jgi:hypothetical protein
MRAWLTGAMTTIVAILGASNLSAQEPPRQGSAVWGYLAGLSTDNRLDILRREARREGGLTIYGAMGIDRFAIVEKTWKEKHPDIKVNFVRQS